MAGHGPRRLVPESRLEADDSEHPCDRLQSFRPPNETRSGFLPAHPRVQLHFTPTYSSWLNQVELWFAKTERDLLARGIFTSMPDLARKIRRYIKRYNKDPKPIR